MATVNDLLTKYSGQLQIDALLGDGPDWNYATALAQPNVLSYTFSTASGNWVENEPPSTYVAFSAAQQGAVRQALTHASSITGIRFVETSDGMQADLHFASRDLASGYAATTQWGAGWSDNGTTLLSYRADAWIYFDSVEELQTFQNPTPGSMGYQIILHELGHALGLKHPHEGTYTLSAAEDNTENTLLSYNWVGAPKSVYQEYDIAAFNWLYGGDGLGGLGFGDTGAQSLVIAGTTGNDSLVGGSGNDTLAGGAGNDTLIGGAGNDGLDGGPGADLMDGGAGNDTYIVTTGDVIRDSGGIDNVGAEVSWILGTGLENLVLLGSASINGSGNTLNNILVGNDAANRLDGRAGADTMSGELGNDTYVVSTGDVILDDGGVDTVISNVSWTLGAAFEHLTFNGSAPADGVGNALNNNMRGNIAANRLEAGAGNDTLTGGAGADSMDGGLGNDLFVVSAGDVVSDAGGTDSVRSDVSWTLAAGFENLRLTGSAAIDGTGNGLDNIIIGNGAANRLSGGAGRDTLTGGAGQDFFDFLAAPGIANADRIRDFATGVDKIRLDDAVHANSGAAGNFASGDARFWAAPGAAAGHDATDRVIYNSSTGALYYDADGSGTGASQLIATLSGSLAATDITLI